MVWIAEIGANNMMTNISHINHVTTQYAILGGVKY